MNYKLTKDWGDHKEGDVLNTEADLTTLTADEIAALITDGTFEPVVDEANFHSVTVDQAWLDAHPDAVAAGVQLGDTVQEPNEEVVVNAIEEKEEDEEVEAHDEIVKKMTYRGQGVISDTMRVVEGKEYRNLTLEDGSNVDVTDEEWAEMLDAAK